MHSTDLFYFIQNGTKVLEPTGDRVLAQVVPTYERKCWADRIGKVWAIAQWRVPSMSRQVWEQQVFGGLFPYPENGQWYFVDNTQLTDGMPPDEDTTALAIYGLRSQMEMNPATFVYEHERAEAREREQRIEEMADQVAEELPLADVMVQGYSE